LNNETRVLDFVGGAGSNGVSDSDIVAATGIKQQKQVMQITRKLLDSGKISGKWQKGQWQFAASTFQRSPNSTSALENAATLLDDIPVPRKFLKCAVETMSQLYDAPLRALSVPPVGRYFDLVSADKKICGEVNYFALVRGLGSPIAKLALIGEQLWLLERTTAKKKFLLFGNDPKMPALWLQRFGHIERSVDFFFLSDSGVLEKIG
jgi:hypothetical protein